MSKYNLFYNKAVALYKAGNHFLYPALVYGSEYYTKAEAKILDGVINELTEKAHCLAVKHHPTWFSALKSGASEAECLRAWKHDDPKGVYLENLKYK